MKSKITAKKVEPHLRTQLTAKPGQKLIRSRDQKTIQLWSKNKEMKRLTKKEAQQIELNQNDNSRGKSKWLGKSYAHALQSTITNIFFETEHFMPPVIQSKKTNGFKQCQQR